MKKLTFWKSLFLLCALIVGSSSAWAADETFNLSYSNGTAVTTVNGTDVKLTFDKGTGSNAPTYYTNSPVGVRLYGGGTLTVSSTTKLIASVKFTFNQKNASGFSISSSGATSVTSGSSPITFTCSSDGASSVTFTNTGSSGNYAFTKVEVTFKATGPAVNADNINIACDATSGEIPYTISNPDGSSLTAAEKGDGYDWIDDVAVDATNSKVTFTTTENEGAERSGIIVLTYGSVSKEVTVTQAVGVAKHVVTIYAPENGTLVVKRGETAISSGDQIPEGTVLTIVTTPAENYAFHNWQYRRDGGSWVSNTAATTYTMTDKDVELRANFDPTHLVNFSVNGQYVSSSRFAENKNITFPESVTTFGGFTFVGWAESAIDGSVTDEPTLIDINEEKMGIADKTYYAVYGKINYTTPISATFKASDTSNLTKDSQKLEWTDNTTGIKMFIASGQLFAGNSNNPAAFNAYSGSYMTLSATDAVLTNVVVSTTGSNYQISGVSPGLLSTSGTTQTITFTPYTFNVKCDAPSNNQLRATQIVVNALSAEIINYSTTLKQSATITAAAKYATFWSPSALNFTGTGITVYAAEDKESSVGLNEVTTGKVPANTPVVLYNPEANGNAISVPVIASADVIEENDLVIKGDGADVDYMYVLAKKNNKVGFYKWAGTNLSAGKVYLQGKASYGAREFLGFDDTATSINNVEISDEFDDNTPMYNLAGQRVTKSYKGVVIVNGKKMLNK